MWYNNSITNKEVINMTNLTTKLLRQQTMLLKEMTEDENKDYYDELFKLYKETFDLFEYITIAEKSKC